MCFFKSVMWFLLVCVYCVNCEEGSECVSEDGKRGMCVKFNHCMGVIQNMQEGRRPKICSFEGQTPIVCCTDCYRINNTSYVVIDKSGDFYFKRGQKSFDKCLDYMVSLPYSCDPHDGLKQFWDEVRQCHYYSVVQVYSAAGGIDAKRAEYPHMALLGYGDDLNSVEWLCGGSVISEKYILTAAHCISSSALGPVTYAALGILKRTDPSALWQRHRVKRIIPHPQYQPPSKYHDIALLETEDQIQFGKTVLPACLNPGDAWDFNGYATGWGALGHRQQLADTLQTVLLIKFSEEQCSAQYPPYRLLRSGYDHARQMCYGDNDNPRDTCEGDSGGPLQTTSAYSSCQHVVLGVTSYGRACGTPGNSGMYTRVSYYLPWIESVVWP